MYTYDYDLSFSPAMSVVDVAITTIEQNEPHITLSAMVDSGADGTLIPLSHLRSINARRTGQVVLRSVTESREVVNIYEVSLRIGSHHFPHLRVAADPHNEIPILGRDVLNHLIVTLNGLASATEILE